MSALATPAEGDEGLERRVRRAADLLARREAWLAPSRAGTGAGYEVRIGPDGRRRALLTLEEAVFRRLVREPGLKPRPEAGWMLAGRQARSEPPPPPGRPSLIEGERSVVDPDARPGGALVRRRVNLGESPLEWLARHKDADGRPWLDAVEVRAGERLRDDFQSAGALGRLTMAWDAGPRAKGGRAPGLDPAERARAAKGRIEAALAAVGPQGRGLVQHICLAGTALEAAERALGLPRRTGKHVLKAALDRLAQHYRMR